MSKKSPSKKDLKLALKHLEKEVEWSLDDIDRDTKSLVERLLVKRIARLSDKAAVFIDLYKESLDV